MAIYPKLIMDALEKVRYPGTGKNIVEAGMVEDNIRIDGNKVSFSLIFPKETDPFIKSVVRSAEASLKAYVSKDLEVHITTRKAEETRACASRHKEHNSRFIGQRRCGKVNCCGQSRSFARHEGLSCRTSRRRYFRTLHAEDVSFGRISAVR